MLDIEEGIKKLFHKHFNSSLKSIQAIQGSGSNRKYYVLETEDEKLMACFSENIDENKLFIELAKIASDKGLHVPRVLAIDKSKRMYIQSFEGDLDLLTEVKTQTWNTHTIALYKTALTELVDFRKAIGLKKSALKKINGSLNRTFILHDLLYFKFYFLDFLKINYNKGELLTLFEHIAKQFENKYPTLIYRDFQARNILINAGKLTLIDFQGAMPGPPTYDLVSLLWQAQAKMPHTIKSELKTYYFDLYKNTQAIDLDLQSFEQDYQWNVLVRILQTLGAYGLKGLVEDKSHFKNSIALALENLKWVLENFDFKINLKSHFAAITNPSFISQFETKVKKDAPLAIEINSFSYKKGIPVDVSGNGGGFVFDMRGILNPGRFEKYKQQSGLDQNVVTFLEHETKMPVFIAHVKKTIDIAIQDYIARDFAHLMINFGCTGGQHRSVYAAEKINAYIQSEYGLQTKLKHTNQENWVK